MAVCSSESESNLQSAIFSPQAIEVVELRRYTTQPGKRDVLIDLFERRFLESQEACGMLPIGHFRNLDNADSFVWLRGFSGMHARRTALEDFYLHSQVWRENRDAANATLVDSDDVLLLRNARDGSGLDLRGLGRPAADRRIACSNTFVGVALMMLTRPADKALIDAFERELLPGLRAISQRTAYFVTERRPNDFPQLPVRESAFALVVVSVCANSDALTTWEDQFSASTWEVLRLMPAARSLLR